MPTINLTTKYLEDAQGNKYAPVTVPSAVRWSNGDDLDDKLAAKQTVIDSSNKLSASNVSGLATVATSGSYSDLSNKPTTMGASGSGHASGLVPDPGSTAGTSKYLREDGTWAEPSGGSVMGASGSSHASGLTPDTPSTAGNSKFLCENATWRNPLTKTIDFNPMVLGVNGISNLPAFLTIERRIIYDYQNDVFYFIISGSPVQFTHPTWSEFYISDVVEETTLLYSNGVITDVTQNPPYGIYICSWGMYNAPGEVYYVFLNGRTFVGSVSFSDINSTSYDKELLGLPIGGSEIISLANIPTTANVVVADISSNQSTVSIDGVSYNSGSYSFGDFTDGKELHVFVPNYYGASSLTITLPTALPYILCGDDSALTVDVGEVAEINFISCASSQGAVYVKAVKSAMTFTYPYLT